MKYIITSFISVWLSISTSFAQLNLVGTRFSHRQKEKQNLFKRLFTRNNNWNQFTKWDSVNVPIVVDGDKRTITIDHKAKMVFKIVSQNDATITDEGDKVTCLNTIDADKVNCNVYLIDKGKSLWMVVYYKDLNLCYDVVEN